MTTTCTITCTASSQQLTLGSGHSRLLVPRTNELELELDASESVRFQISDFVYAGHNYSVVVTATRNGVVQTWERSNGVSSSPVENGEIDLDLDVTATAPGVAPSIGGGTVRIRFKGKPD